MKRVDVTYGIRERVNDLLGTTSNSTSTTLNSWSIQESMLDNIRRAIKGLVGSGSLGRIGYGLEVDASGHVSSGVGFTSNGDIIYWSNPGNPIIAPASGGTLYLKATSERTGDHSSQTTSKDINIIIDNKQDSSCFTTTATSGSCVLIGTVTVTAGVYTCARPYSAGFDKYVSPVGVTKTITDMSTVTSMTITNGIITAVTP